MTRPKSQYDISSKIQQSPHGAKQGPDFVQFRHVSPALLAYWYNLFIKLLLHISIKCDSLSLLTP